MRREQRLQKTDAATRKLAPIRMLIELPTIAEVFSRGRVSITPSRFLLVKVKSPKRENPSARMTRLILADMRFRYVRVFTAAVVFLNFGNLYLHSSFGSR